MNIVAVHQRCDLAFLASAAKHKSLFCRQVLTLTPRKYVEWDKREGFAYLTLGRPASSAVLTVADSLGLDVAESIVARKHSQPADHGKAYSRNYKESPEV